MSAYVFPCTLLPPPPAAAREELRRAVVTCRGFVSNAFLRHRALTQMAMAAANSAGAAHHAASSSRENTVGTTMPATELLESPPAGAGGATVGEGVAVPVEGGVAVREGEGVLLGVPVEDGDTVGVREGVGAAVPDHEAETVGLAAADAEGVTVGVVVATLEGVGDAEAAGAGALTLKPSTAVLPGIQGGAADTLHWILLLLTSAAAVL